MGGSRRCSSKAWRNAQAAAARGIARRARVRVRIAVLPIASCRLTQRPVEKSAGPACRILRAKSAQHSLLCLEQEWGSATPAISARKLMTLSSKPVGNTAARVGRKTAQGLCRLFAHWCATTTTGNPTPRTTAEAAAGCGSCSAARGANAPKTLRSLRSMRFPSRGNRTDRTFAHIVTHIVQAVAEQARRHAAHLSLQKWGCKPGKPSGFP
jgi:hypothetical protein